MIEDGDQSSVLIAENAPHLPQPTVQFQAVIDAVAGGDAAQVLLE